MVAEQVPLGGSLSLRLPCVTGCLPAVAHGCRPPGIFLYPAPCLPNHPCLLAHDPSICPLPVDGQGLLEAEDGLG